jgi:6-methylsalicylate decarboxylase
MAELDRRNAIVASKPAPYDQRACGLDAGVFVEFLCDTTRAATNLIFSGTMKKYPRITVAWAIMVHGKRYNEPKLLMGA